jgi:feruloyl esterase
MGASTSDFARMFLVHGMDHCDYFDRGGISVSDWLSPWVAWVEGGTAPDSVSGRSKAGGANPLFTRPVCAWPKVATYSGTGVRTDAANWSCQ